MTVRCPSCGVSLRVNRERLGGRTSAACPKCRAAIELSSATSQAETPDPAETITIVCSSCAAKLRASVSRAGSKSRCPRCRSQVTIGRAGRQPTGSMSDEPEAAGVATRRIDSRTLGLEMGAMAGPSLASNEIDLEEFIKAMPPPDPATGHSAAEGIAASLMNPRVGAMAEAAHKIRAAAQDLAEPARTQAAAGAATARKQGAATKTSAPSEPIALGTAAAEQVTPARGSRPASTAPAPKATARLRPFPMGRGILAGAAAGLAICGASLLLQPWLEARSLTWLLAPLPAAEFGLPPGAIRALLLAVLAALAGLVAAGTGSPTSNDRPLRIVRCMAAGALTGAAAGTLVSMDPASASTTFSVWPIVNWLRDLLLAGLLTPALNRLLPPRDA